MGKSMIEKKKYPEIDLSVFVKEGKIAIENSSHCWSLTKEGYDAFALKLYSLLINYQEIGIVPVKFGIFS